MATLLVGYDVEHQLKDRTTADFLEAVVKVHTAWKAPLTLFLLGRTLELNVAAIQEAASHPLVSIGQHTYSHMLFKTLYVERRDSAELVLAGTPEAIDLELRATNELIDHHLGIRCTGLTAPYNYYRGLRDRPDVLAVLAKNGIKFVRAEGRDSHDYQPAPMTQPYWYDQSGYPEILEMATHGWHDCLVRDEVLGWEDIDGYVDIVKSYIDKAVADDSIYSVCAHDWSSRRADPELRHVSQILEYALDRGMDIRSYEQVYNRFAEERYLSSVPTDQPA